MGVVTEKPFRVYPDGFPKEVITEFERLTGRGVLGNEPASGTEIINRLGEQHLKTGALIVYTSADSVFQIAAHEDIVSVAELYEYCRQARGLLRGEHELVRVIARPFTQQPGHFAPPPRLRPLSTHPPPPHLPRPADLVLPGRDDLLDLPLAPDVGKLELPAQGDNRPLHVAQLVLRREQLAFLGVVLWTRHCWVPERAF